MRLIEAVLGSRLDETLAERLHRLDHVGSLDRLVVRSAEIQRRRFKAITSSGEDVAVALPRDQALYHGAVLVCDDGYALVVEVPEPQWLRCVPRDMEAALALAYSAGNLHWRVRFEGPVLLVAQEGSLDTYRARLARLLESGMVSIASEPVHPC